MKKTVKPVKKGARKVAANQKSVVRGMTSKSKGKQGLLRKLLPKLVSKGMLVFWLVLFGAIGVKMTLFSSAATFQYVGKFPGAAAQPTDSAGQVIRTLKAFNGKIYAGYGDWDRNTGPVSMNPYDPISNTFGATEFQADTEAIDLFHVIDGKLFAASTDPRRSNDYSVASLVDGVPKWTGTTPIGMVHDFDFAQLNGTNDLWLAGSKSMGTGFDHAVVYHSTDGGNTWNLSLDVAGSRDKHARFYMIGAYQGKLYTQAIEFGNDYVANMMPKSKVYDGNRWGDGPALAGTGIYYHATEFAGKMVFQTYTRGGSLVAFDGRSSSFLKSARNYTIAPDGYLYLLGGDATISKTNDLVTWQNVAIAPSSATSIEVLDGDIYVGTYASELYRASMGLIAADKTAPKINMTTPVSGTTVGGTTPINIEASDENGVVKVELYIDGRLWTNLKQAPYNFNWNTIGYTNGTHTIKAIVYDASMNSTSTPDVSVLVANSPSSDTTAPVITVVSPASGTKLKGQATLKGYAYDNVGIARMEILVDGTVVATGTGSSSLSTKYQTRNLTPGTHTLTVNAYDAAGNKGTKSSLVTK